MSDAVALRFDTTGTWATARVDADLEAWADRISAARGNPGLWRTVAGRLFTPAYPGAYAAMVLAPSSLDAAPTMVLRMIGHAGRLPSLEAGTIRESADEPWIDEPVLEPLETAAGTAHRVAARFTQPTEDGDDVGVLLAYLWWFPDTGETIELRTVMAEYLDLQRALPAADALAASAARADGGPPAA